MVRNTESKRAVMMGGCIALSLGFAAQSQTLMFDFGNSRPDDSGTVTASPDVNGNTWNNMSGPFFADTVDTTGASTGIGIGFVSNYGANGGIANGGLFAPSPALIGEFAIETATQDYFYCTPLDPAITMLTFDMWGYDDADTVTFKFFGSRAAFDDRDTQYTARNTDLVSVSGSSATSGFAISNDGSSDGNDTAVVELAGINSVNGLITIDVEVLFGDFAYINAMSVEIVSVPDCQADTNGDGILDNGDIGMFVTLFLAADMAADFNGDGILDNGDIGTFVNAFLAGC